MTQKMPTRSSSPVRRRDWGNTPVLFSLKNVQPMLVTGPARPEGVVAAPSSFTEPEIAAAATSASIPSGEPVENRSKPQAAPLKSYSYQNWAATAFVVLLILFVVRISLNETPAEKTGSSQASAEPAAKSPATETVASKKEENKLPAVATPNASNFVLDAPKPSVESGLLIPTTIAPKQESTSPELKISSTGVEAASIPPMLTAEEFNKPAPTAPTLMASAPVANPTPYVPVNSPSFPEAGMGGGFAPQNSSVGPGNGASPFSTNAPAGMNFEAAKPEMLLGPAAPEPMASLPKSGEVAVNIQPTLTPDEPYAVFKDLYDRARQFNGEPTSGYVPASTVSTSGQIMTGQAYSGQPIPGQASTGHSTTGYQPLYGSTSGSPTAGGQPAAGQTQLSGQSYPPSQQPYQPISMQDNGNAGVNRYQPIRQPAANTPSASANGGQPYVPSSTQAPYVPMGASAYPNTTGVPDLNGAAYPNMGFTPAP